MFRTLSELKRGAFPLTMPLNLGRLGEQSRQGSLV
jgi:hypothetical protein